MDPFDEIFTALINKCPIYAYAIHYSFRQAGSHNSKLPSSFRGNNHMLNRVFLEMIELIFCRFYRNGKMNLCQYIVSNPLHNLMLPEIEKLHKKHN